MTVTHKQVAAKRRDNPTPAEDLLWDELRGLNTAARFTRKKFRYGHLVDFWNESLRIGILIDDPQGHKEQRNGLRRVLANVDPKIDLIEFRAEDIRDNPGAMRIQVTKRVYELLLEKVDPIVRPVVGVKDVRLDGPFKIHVDLVGSGTPEIYQEIHETILSFARGAQVEVQEEVGVEPSPQVTPAPSDEIKEI